MNKKTVSGILITLFLAITMSNVTPVTSSPTTTMSVDPPSIVDPTKTPGSTFNISIMVYDVEACYCWQVHMNWSTAVLNLTSDVYDYYGKTVTVPHITFGDFMADAPHGTVTAKFVNYDEGWCEFGEAMIGDAPEDRAGISGSGWLATLEFTVVGTGETVIDIEYGAGVEPYASTFMGTYYGEDIEMVAENGYFSNTATMYDITIDSDPSDGVDFTIDGEAQTTTWSGSVVEGNHTVVMPSTWTDGPNFFVFDHWEDDSTNPTRTVSLTAGMTITAYYVAETVVAVDPPTNTANIGETFTVDINIVDAEDLYSWGIKVQWDRDILDAIDVTEGPFLQGQPDGTAFVKIIDNWFGRINVGCTTLGDWFGVWGNGTLMTVTFNVTGTGETDLDIYYAELFNYDLAWIPHTTEDGYFSNTEPAPPTTISVDPPMLFAELGEHFTINLAITNGVNVYGWQANLTFDPSVLQVADAALPPDHFLAGAPEGVVGLQKGIFSHSVLVGTCILGDYLGMNGSGTLVTIEFEVVGIGESILGIDDTPGLEAWTYVLDHNLTCVGPPELKTEDGYFTNIGPRFFVSASPSSLTIQKGNSAVSIINVTSLDGFSDTISLSVSSVPSGVTTIFNPPQVTPPPNDIVTSTLTIQASLTAVPGSYVFTITGTNSTLQHSVDVILEITEQTPPHASFFYSPIEPQVDEAVTFNASASFDLDGTIETYAWDFGDGTTDTAIIVTHVFTTAGSYNVTLTVTDDDGLSDASAQSVTVAKQSSTIFVTTSTTTLTIGENITINGCISPTRAGATVIIEHRLLGGTWSILTAAATDENSECSHVWIPSKTGTYELEASWSGDVNTLPAESLIVIIDVIPPRVLSIKLSGEHDYLLMERVKIRLAALVRNAATMEPVSNANVTISIYNPDGTHWLSDTMVEKLAETGVYEWESEGTIQQLRLEKGVYLAHVNASSEGSLVASDIIEFHIDPPSEEPVQLHLILLSVLATAISVWYVQRRRLSKKLSELQKRTH